MQVSDSARELGKMMVSDEEFSQFIDKEIEFNKSTITSGTDGMAPRIILYTKKSNNAPWEIGYCAFADFPDVDNRRETFEKMGYEFAKQKPDGKRFYPMVAIMTTEAWVKSMTPEEVKERDEAEKPKMVSEYADKKEVIITAGITLDGREQTATMDITRDDKNNMIAGELMKMTSTENFLLRAFMGGFAKYIVEEKQKDQTRN